MKAILKESVKTDIKKPENAKKKIKVRAVNRVYDDGHSWTTIDEFGRRITLKWWY